MGDAPGKTQFETRSDSPQALRGPQNALPGSFANAVSGGASTDGCVVERSGAHVYDDASPSWGGYFGVGNVATDPAYSCPTATVLPLTDIYQQSKVDEIKQRINALKGFGGTAGHLGVAWGFYTLSPNWGSIWPYDSRPRSYDPEKTIKTIVLMTDGMFNVSYDTAAENKWPNVNAENSTIAGTSGFQALKICEEARKSGREIRIYAVGFQTTLAAEELLKECAGADNFFTADTAAELSEAFRTIAESLTSMRVSG